MRALLLAALLAWAATAKAGLDWDSLWQTPDQRGEQLLKRGDPAAAAGVFRDPRRKAYAELQAGDYARAAQDFARFDDSDSQYNRGNALARAGDLQAALKAYDAALARDPGNRDARHNRDLVAEALKRQPAKPQSSAGSGKQGHPQQNGGKQAQSGGNGGGQQTGSSEQSSQAGNQDKTGQNGKSNGSGRNSQNQSAQDKAESDQAKAGAGQNPSSSGQRQPNPSPTALNGKSAASPPPQPGRASQMDQAGQQAGANPPGKDTAAEARADAEAALHGQANGVATDDAPLSERQLAQQQWLRRIPDDPGGLLRRKFMIEHMLRQQGGQP